GLHVLAVDRVSFPSDTISSHQLQVPGVALLHRWGLLNKLTDAGTPPARRVRFDSGGLVMDGQFPAYEGVDALYSPRRTLLDTTLAEAAREAGAEVRENFRVTEVTFSAGRVTGIRGAARGRPEVTETASLVIGADGKRSLVAGAVGARRYRERPARSFASYSYWAGVPVTGGELYQRPGRAVAVFPTNDELTMVYAAAPMTEFASARADLEGHYLRTLDLCGDLGERVRSGSRAERLRTTPDQPNMFRYPHGPGWALAGDAGVVMDSISAQGMTNALRDASYLSGAVAAGLGGSRPLAEALRDHQRRRDRAIRGVYDFTLGLAAFPPATPAQRLFLAAVAADEQETDRFLGAFTGIVPPEQYFTLGTAVRLLGTRGIRKLMRAGVLPVGAHLGCWL
ncbi:MAG TPA: FAD-dependent monooxygenase, partial [Streptosporangiaceae bacterium]|nr:FAD-dependent monooxygenase [Streptosporangiaceae bacterium]